MRDFYLGILILACLLLIPAQPARAETVRVTLFADEITYDYDAKQIEATGNVRIAYKETKVEADYALIDQEQNILLATGKVKVVKDGDEFSGDRFLYYLESRQGWVYPVITEVTDGEIKEPVKFTAAEAFIKGEELLFKKAHFTSCDRAKPHYHFTASQIEYYPEKRIKMRGVWYWEDGVRLFYLPVLTISLEEDSSNFGAQLGHNNVEGWWLLTWYSYYFNDNNSVMIRNRTTERGTDWWEVQHTHKLTPTRTFTGAYQIQDKDKIGIFYDDYLAGFKYVDHTYPKLNYQTSLDNWSRHTGDGEGYWENKYNFTLRGQSPYPFVQLDYSATGLDGLREINFQENWKHNSQDRTMSLSLGGRWFYSEKSLIRYGPTENFTYDVNFDKNWVWSQLAFRAHDSKTVGYSSENVIPDITYTIPKWKWPLVGDVKVISQYTHKEKYNGVTDIETEGERSALDAQKTNDIWNKGSLSLSSQANFRFRNYLVNDLSTDLSALTGQLNLKNKFTKELSTAVALGFTEMQGVSNQFFSENIRPGADIWNDWNWNSSQLQANLRTGYNFETEFAYPLTFDAMWSPGHTRMSFRTTYHWDNGPAYQVGLREASLEINSNPKQDWYFRLFLNYDFWSDMWGSKIMDLQVTEKVSSKWTMSLKAIYDMFINDFSNANITFVYDWHCRDLKIHYDWVEREYWLQLTFKAFPQASFKTSDNPWEYLNYE